ncbi:MAG: threonine synthase [Balneolaceae bacterium]|jgi:threonine synthase
MEFISTNGKSKPVSFAKAALKGLAPDGGLFVPEYWPKLADPFLNSLQAKTLPEIGYEISRLFVDELDSVVLRDIVEDAINFKVPLVELETGIQVLELFHGPTLAFKDFGARFMARIFSALRKKSDGDLIILAATSGDTGSAVAQGFLGVDGIQVCLLYPSGKVSRIQEQQLTTAGRNVTALEVNGSFDDCQRMVKKAFSDNVLNKQLLLSSANSINIVRLIPQMFYYLYAVAQLDKAVRPIFCVPSGNFGNLTAGLMAEKMGMPTSGFIAATNVNDVVPEYLETGSFKPRASRQTISNAMDVGNPSNFARILYLFGDDYQEIKRHIWGASFSDSDTREAVEQVYKNFDYLMDPHTAIGYRAVRKYQQVARGYFGENPSAPFIILSTAHPAKFEDVIEAVINEKVAIPQRLKECLVKEKQSVPIQNDYKQLKNWLLRKYRA